ncbi:MAG TPA: hypothetical protein VJ725_18230 [Thermoanaerobaculia bacterium]|nr:hypothetical protein [Thermoanaerobaculia bacterium]
MIRPGENTTNQVAFLSRRMELPLDIIPVPERDQEPAVFSVEDFFALLNVVQAGAKSETREWKSLDERAGPG